jgi:pyruvate formate lyase activating enzyme
MESIKGMVFNIQRYSIDDGPGIRTTVFLKGCPLRCLWCSNPESQNPCPEIAHRESSCKRCGRCVEVCPVQAISLTEGAIRIDRNLCDNCGECVSECPHEALKIFGKEMTVDEVFAVVRKDKDYYKVTGGGVTVSGGEPLAQAEFAAALLKRCQEAGIHTCLDTSGYGAQPDLEKILPYTALVLFDLKHMDPVLHREYTGCDNELVLRNLELVVKNGTPLIIRIPLIPGHNDSDEQLAAFARVAAEVAKGAPVNIMPYHRYGTGKYKMLDLPYQLDDLKPPAEERLQRAKEIFNSFGLECEIKI